MEDVVSILTDLHKYVPVLREEHVITEDGENFTLTADYFHYLLFGGDQLTCARIRSAQRIRENSSSGQGRLEGLLPCIEDWHAKVVFLQVS